MTLYIRGYEDYSYEVIFLDGVFKKNRVHILINPGNYIKLPGQGGESDVEINIESLTHILTMETSITNPDIIKRTTYIAERTNKPIITNQETGDKFRTEGLSVKQLRIIGFEEEVVEGIHVDPVYLGELPVAVEEENSHSFLYIGEMMKMINPLNWKPVQKISDMILPHPKSSQDIDTSKPLAFHIELGSKLNLLLPLDERGVDNINKILPQMHVHTLVVPNKELSYTSEINEPVSNVLLLNRSFSDDQVLIIPKSHNPGIDHDTHYGALEEWIEIK